MPDITWPDRIASYRRAFPNFPCCMAVGEDGRLFGTWNIGNSYHVASGYHGGYPHTYLRRLRALFYEPRRVLHLFSGRVDLDAFPGDTVDLRADLSPTYLDDAQTLDRVPLERYDLVLADPPYSSEDAERYGQTMVKRNAVMRALSRLPAGAQVVWLDQMRPMYRKAEWALEGDLGCWLDDGEIHMVRSTNHRYRGVMFLRRRGDA